MDGGGAFNRDFLTVSGYRVMVEARVEADKK